MDTPMSALRHTGVYDTAVLYDRKDGIENLLTHVIQTDMATGVANQAVFMGYAANLFAQRKLDALRLFCVNWAKRPPRRVRKHSSSSGI